MLDKIKIRVKTLKGVSGCPVRSNVATEKNPAMAELVKNRAWTLDIMNPLMRISEISLLLKGTIKRKTLFISQSYRSES